MATKPTNAEAEQLTAANLTVDNSITSQEVQAEVIKKGYDLAALQTGKGKITAAQLALNDQSMKESAAENATDREEECKAEAHQAYHDLAKTIRTKYHEGSPELIAVGLTGSEPRALGKFVEAGYKLFDNSASTHAVAQYILTKGYTPEFLQSERAKITAYEQANQAQEPALSAAKDATKIKKKAFKDMNDWLREYIENAKIVMREKPALLEAIGIKVSKHKSPTKKNKPQNPPAK